MIQPITRNEVFLKSKLADDLEDHMEPFSEDEGITNDSAVLGYLTKDREYAAKRTAALIRFFEIMHISKLYLIDEFKYDWIRFPYSNFDKRNALKSIVNLPSYREAFEIDIADLATALPWFTYSSRHSIPIVFFISTDDTIPIAMFLCDDGNFHTSFHSDDREKIFYAASAVDFTMGGVEICSM